MARLSLLVLLGVLAGASAAGQVQKVTPVEKVVELLEKLGKKVESEGAAEAKAYDKFACFCKEQADEKLYAKEKSTKIIAELDAQITLLKSEINTLNGEISALGNTIQGLTSKIELAEEARATEHRTYLAAEADMSSAIAAVNGAIEALKSSKGQMGGKTDAEALVQVRRAAVLSIAMVKGRSVRGVSQKHMAVLASLARQPGKAYEYEYHSNDIISTLEDLLQTFTDNKNELDQDEFDAKAAFEKKRLGLQNERKFASKDKAEKEALQEKKTEENSKATEDRLEEQKDFDADAAFLKALTADCEEKGRLWDQRSTTRAGELQAIEKAVTSLKEGVQPNYGANKKLSGLVQTRSLPVAAAKAKAAPSFLQLRKSVSKEAQQKQTVQKVEAFLVQQGARLRSSVLSTAAMRVQVSEDHFVKVRTLIKDLLSKLSDDAEAEATQKGFCDQNMAAAIAKRDKNQGQIESDTAVIARLNAEDKQLEKDIADLTAGIASNLKAKKEATELRDGDKAENEQTVIDAEAGKNAVEYALQVLKDFYGGAALSFLQFDPAARVTAANMDRSGKTISDMAPEVFDSEYGGSQSNSKGIVGMLEVIVSDFDRTIESTTSQEQAEASDHEQFVTEVDADTKTKEGSVTAKTSRRTEIEGELLAQTDSKTQAEGKLKAALDELTVLHSQCVAGEESYAERVAKRNKEIAALKEAHAILEDWQS